MYEDFIEKGNVSQAWIFRCRSCIATHTVESVRGRLTLEKAEKWAREEHWRKTKSGWKCPVCAKTKMLTYSAERDQWTNEKGEVRA